MAMSDHHAQLATKVARFGLPNEDPTPIEFTDEDWMPQRQVLLGHKLVGLAAAASQAGRLSLTGSQAEALRAQHRVAMMHSLALERKLITLVTALENVGIQAIVLKGPVLAHSYYPDPSWRPFVDLDLLVRTANWSDACELIETLGFQRARPESRPGFVERFGKAAVHTDEQGFQVDLHRTLVAGPFGLWMNPEELFERQTTFGLAGSHFRRLDDSALFIHLCVHAALGDMKPFLLHQRDVAQVVGSANIDWEVVHSCTVRWKLQGVVAHALRAVHDKLRVELPEQAEPLVDRQTLPRERRAIAAYTTERRTRGGTAVSTLRAIPGLRPKATYARALLFPSRAFLAARTARGKRPSYLRRWMTPLRWLAGKGP